MKRFLIGTTIFASLAAPLTVFAGDLNPCSPTDSLQCQVAKLGIGSVVGQLVQFIFVVAVILALGFLVYGGIRWITSGGDKTGVETARNTIIAAIIGLIVVFLAYVILNLVLQFLTGGDISAIKIPTIAECKPAIWDDTTGLITQCDATKVTDPQYSCGTDGKVCFRVKGT